MWPTSDLIRPEAHPHLARSDHMRHAPRWPRLCTPRCHLTAIVSLHPWSRPAAHHLTALPHVCCVGLILMRHQWSQCLFRRCCAPAPFQHHHTATIAILPRSSVLSAIDDCHVKPLTAAVLMRRRSPLSRAVLKQLHYEDHPKPAPRSAHRHDSPMPAVPGHYPVSPTPPRAPCQQPTVSWPVCRPPRPPNCLSHRRSPSLRAPCWRQPRPAMESPRHHRTSFMLVPRPSPTPSRCWWPLIWLHGALPRWAANLVFFLLMGYFHPGAAPWHLPTPARRWEPLDLTSSTMGAGQLPCFSFWATRTSWPTNLDGLSRKLAHQAR
jgi:hypothetical protein